MNLAAVLARADRSALLALSDEPPAGWARVLAAEGEGYWRGYRLAEATHASDYDAGYRDGVFARKHAGIALRDLVELEGKRWGPGGREHFGDPRRGELLSPTRTARPRSCKARSAGYCTPPAHCHRSLVTCRR